MVTIVDFEEYRPRPNKDPLVNCIKAGWGY